MFFFSDVLRSIEKQLELLQFSRFLHEMQRFMELLSSEEPF